MSSSAKTSNLTLNNWLGSDIPERADFVNDNQIIDIAIHEHRTNTEAHTNQTEREKWNTPYYKFTFTGDGSSTRTVETNCPFNPSWGIIFATTMMPSVIDIANASNYNYFGIFSTGGSTSGLSITNGNKIKVYNSATAVQTTEYRRYNQSGIVYCVIMFR